MGCATCDHRHLTADLKRMNTVTLPAWVTTTMRSSLNDNDGFTCDDFAAILADDSGENMAYDKISISLGRLPVRSLDEATSTVDKLCEYVKSSKKTDWRNQVLILADDEDQAIHMTQADNFEKISRTPTRAFSLPIRYISTPTKRYQAPFRELARRCSDSWTPAWRIGYTSDTPPTTA